MATFKVRIDADRCIGAGLCVMRAPKVFDQTEDGIVVLLDAEPPPDQHEGVRKAADLCPAEAIFIDESP